MNLIFSKRLFFGQIYAISIGFILLILSGFFFFDILTSYPGSDFSNNLANVNAARTGMQWRGPNTPTSVFHYLIELHFYFWLGILGNIFQDSEALLRGITLFLTFIFVYPTLNLAAQLNNKCLLFALLFVLFIHPRFMDLVISNIRSASALVFVFYSLRVNRIKLKFLLMGVAATFHLAVLAPLLQAMNVQAK